MAFFEEEQLKKAIEFKTTAFKNQNFWLKIEIAYAFKIFDQETRNGLHIVREIRNKFAHKSDPLKFECGEVADKCRKLKAYRTPANLRERYLNYLREVEVNDLWPLAARNGREGMPDDRGLRMTESEELKTLRARVAKLLRGVIDDMLKAELDRREGKTER